jgi:DNA-binding MarR family transcriptional regulator
MKIGQLVSTASAEQAIAKHSTAKRHVVVFSADGTIEIPIYKFADGRFCPTWYDAAGAMIRRPKKQLSNAIKIAQEICGQLWEAGGFGTKEECRVLVQEPELQPKRTHRRQNNLFAPPGTAEIEAPVPFRPSEYGWRPLLIGLVCATDLTPTQKLVIFYAWDRGFNSGEFYAYKKTTARETRISSRYVKPVFHELVRRGWFIEKPKSADGRARYRLSLPRSIFIRLTEAKRKLEVELSSTHRRGTDFTPGGEVCSQPGNCFPPKPSNEPLIINNPITRRSAVTRAQSRGREEEILQTLRELLGEAEMKKNGGEWRLRIRHNTRAVIMAIEDLKDARPRWHELRNKGAWTNDRYCRALVALDEEGRRKEGGCSERKNGGVLRYERAQRALSR